jgi:uncharacterized protein (TIGR02600 family)
MRCPRPALSRTTRSFALLMVLASLALLTALVVSVLSLSTTNLRSSHADAHSLASSSLADLGPALVTAQIASSLAFLADGAPTTYASQPGAQRVYDTHGDFVAGFRLYSSSLMTSIPPSPGPEAEATFANDAPPAHWQQLPAHYTDLNSPLFRPSSSGAPSLSFPIADPRSSAEGFAYDPDFPGAMPPTAADAARLPMPVAWLYILRDGTLGTLDPDGRFLGPASPQNPIVGRIAFWADDETSKIPLNTASEPTTWMPPHSYHVEAYRFATSQPVAGEFQRHPGHPATTALSPVLAPGTRWNLPFDTDRASATAAAVAKGQLYALLPRTTDAGSRSGTVSLLDRPTAIKIPNDRLFASPHELALSPERSPNKLHFPDTPAATDPATFGFFLSTAASAPDTTAFGTPRISIWPLPRDPARRTAFDHHSALASSPGPPASAAPYAFQRELPLSPTHDLSLPRNQQLLDYLLHLTSSPHPTGGGSFLDKYGPDRDQILLQIFDYIRAANLTDGHLAASNRSYTPRQGVRGTGYVTPSRWDRPGQPSLVGFGRSYVPSEIGIHFICCADASPERPADEVRAERVRNPFLDQALPPEASGGAAVRAPDPAYPDDPDLFVLYYANCPPLSPARQRAGHAPFYGDIDHPGYAQASWNLALAQDTPLPNHTRRIQSSLLLEWFCASGGFPIIYAPDGIHLRFRGLSNLTLEGQQLFPDDEVLIQRLGDPAHGLNRRGGQDAGLRAGTTRAFDNQPRYLPPRAPHPGDLTTTARGYGKNGGRDDFDLLSNFIDVSVDPAQLNPKMTLACSGEITVELLFTESPAAAPASGHLLHQLTFRFPDTQVLPVPRLYAIRRGKSVETYIDNFGDEQTRTVNSLPPTTFWSYHRLGSFGTTAGRLAAGHHRINDPSTDYRFYDDVIYTLMPYHGDYRLLAARQHIGTTSQNPILHASSPWPYVYTPHRFHSQLASSTGTTTARRRWAHGMSALSHRDFDSGASATSFRRRLMPYRGGPHPVDFPMWDATSVGDLAHRYGDFSAGIANLPDGALIGRPDEGTITIFNPSDARSLNVPYLWGASSNTNPGPHHSFPNRQLPSPVMFGALPTGVLAEDPWRTLLFRPPLDPTSPGAGRTRHHPGQHDPPDHLLLDLFRLPITQPYPHSTPLATRGQVNLNYHLLPFPHISRTTALRAALAAGWIHAIPNEVGQELAPTPAWFGAHRFKETRRRTGTWGAEFSDALRADQPERMFWSASETLDHWLRPIDANTTLAGLDQVQGTHPYHGGRLLQTASQICETHLVPAPAPRDPAAFLDPSLPVPERMKAFWNAHLPTGENLIEYPYAILYPRLTTRSNT